MENKFNTQNGDLTITVDYAALAKSILSKEPDIDYEALAKALVNEASRPPVSPQKRSHKQNEVAMNDDGTYVSRKQQPIKNNEDIVKIRQYYLDRQEYNNHMLFVVGISVGLRISDLLRLRFIDVMDETLTFRDSIMVPEKKTYKKRKFALSDVAKDAIQLYIDKSLHGNFELLDYLFPFRSDAYNRESPTINEKTAYRILGRAFKACGLKMKNGTHTLRKTFAYHVLTDTSDPVERARRLEILQHMLGHYTPLITLAYAGITEEEEANIYKNLDFGIKPILTSSDQEEVVPAWDDSESDRQIER